MPRREAPSHVRPTRRAVLAGGLAGAAAFAFPPCGFADGADGFAHGFSPLGNLAHPAGFRVFASVAPDAPKGGTLRLARIGAFDTTDTLHHPGNPAADLRLCHDGLVTAGEDEIAGFSTASSRAGSASRTTSRASTSASTGVPAGMTGGRSRPTTSHSRSRR